MNRRQFLLAAGAAALAGCNSISRGGTSTPTVTPAPTPTRGSTPTASPTTAAPTTTAAQPEAHLEMSSGSLGIAGESAMADAYASLTVENTGEVRSGYVSLTIDWFDESGGYLGTSRDQLRSLGEGDTWVARVHALAFEADKIADYETALDYQPRFKQPPDGLEVTKSELLSGEAVKVRGELENGSGQYVSYLEFVAELRDDDGVVLGDAWANETGVEAGTRLEFAPRWFGFERNETVATHEAYVNVQNPFEISF